MKTFYLIEPNDIVYVSETDERGKISKTPVRTFRQGAKILDDFIKRGKCP